MHFAIFINYIKRVQHFFQNNFFRLKATKFILVPLSKNKFEIRYSIFCILYHITYMTLETLLYQPLRLIPTFTSISNLIFGGDD